MKLKIICQILPKNLPFQKFTIEKPLNSKIFLKLMTFTIIRIYTHIRKEELERFVSIYVNTHYLREQKN